MNALKNRGVRKFSFLHVEIKLINSDWRLVISTTLGNDLTFHMKHNPKTLRYRLCKWHQVSRFQAFAGNGSGLDTPKPSPYPHRK